ncbi:MAG: class I SAM-dependent methyltransferase [Pseudomonadales bacterium]
MTMTPTVKNLIESRIRGATDGSRPLRILEAGCGRRWPFDLAGIEHVITGVDLDADALEARKNTSKDLDVAVVGDLQTVEFERHSFDVIYCSFVLEHVQGVATVMDNFAAWIRPGGLVVITIPDRRSVHGFVTRVTPHWFHIVYKRYFSPLGKRAGKPGFGPYRTYYDPVMAQPEFYRFCASRGLQPVDEVEFGQLPRYQQHATRLFAALTFNRLKASHINLLYIFQSDAGQAETVGQAKAIRQAI